MKRCILAIACLTLAIAGSAHTAEPQTIEEVIAAVGEAATSIETWSSDIEMIMDMGSMSMSRNTSIRSVMWIA